MSAVLQEGKCFEIIEYAPICHGYEIDRSKCYDYHGHLKIRYGGAVCNELRFQN